jgi:tetratricopeptide (TPR) repeat protein
MRPVLRAGIGWLVLCLGVSLAHGEALEEAKRIAKQASIHYQLGRFADASDEYAKSYELVPVPGLLFNLGQCQLGLKSWDRALFFFEGYLRDKPDAPNAALVRDLIAEARKEIAEQRARAAAAEQARLAALTQAAPPPAPPPPPRMDKRRIIAVALGASSLAFLGTSVYLGLRSDLASNDSRLSPDGSDTQGAFDRDRRNYAIGAGVMGGLALGAAIASGVLGLYAWHPRKAPVVTAAPSTNGASAGVVGAF